MNPPDKFATRFQKGMEIAACLLVGALVGLFVLAYFDAL
jgi:hypothetical protein